MDKNSREFFAGHRGLVGAAIVRNLQAKGYTKLLVRARAGLALTNRFVGKLFLDPNKPDSTPRKRMDATCYALKVGRPRSVWQLESAIFIEQMWKESGHETSAQ